MGHNGTFQYICKDGHVIAVLVTMVTASPFVVTGEASKVEPSEEVTEVPEKASEAPWKMKHDKTTNLPIAKYCQLNLVEVKKSTDVWLKVDTLPRVHFLCSGGWISTCGRGAFAQFEIWNSMKIWKVCIACIAYVDSYTKNHCFFVTNFATYSYTSATIECKLTQVDASVAQVPSTETEVPKEPPEHLGPVEWLGLNSKRIQRIVQSYPFLSGTPRHGRSTIWK